MGKCRYCGLDAGFMKKEHRACREAHDKSIDRVAAVVADCFDRHRDFYLEDRNIRDAAAQAHISDDELQDIYCAALDRAVDAYLDDGLIDRDEERTVARFVQYTALPQQVLNRNRALEKVVQAKVLDDIRNGRHPAPNITVGGDFPFILARGESMVWLFRDVTLHEQKVRREYRGGSSGFSFRIVKGVYYRTGRFKGSPVETSYMQTVGTGMVCLTDRNIYFSSPMKSIKIPYSKIISIESYSNGIGLQKEGPRELPLFLEGVNSWFVYNLVAALR